MIYQRNSKKIVQFDRLRNPAIKPHRQVLSESEPELITNETDSDISLPDTATHQVEKQTKALRLQTTEIAELVAKDRTPVASSLVRVSQEPTQFLVQPQHNGIHAPRVSQRRNKGVAPRRFSPTMM